MGKRNGEMPIMFVFTICSRYYIWNVLQQLILADPLVASVQRARIASILIYVTNAQQTWTENTYLDCLCRCDDESIFNLHTRETPLYRYHKSSHSFIKVNFWAYLCNIFRRLFFKPIALSRNSCFFSTNERLSLSYFAFCFSVVQYYTWHMFFTHEVCIQEIAQLLLNTLGFPYWSKFSPFPVQVSLPSLACIFGTRRTTRSRVFLVNHRNGFKTSHFVFLYIQTYDRLNHCKLFPSKLVLWFDLLSIIRARHHLLWIQVAVPSTVGIIKLESPLCIAPLICLCSSHRDYKRLYRSQPLLGQVCSLSVDLRMRLPTFQASRAIHCDPRLYPFIG